MAKTSLIVKSKRKPRFKVQHVQRCELCGRPRGYMRYFKVCRLCFRKLANAGKIPGLRKSSW